MNDLSAPEPNIPLLRKAVEWAEAEAAKTDGPCMWNQSEWAQVTDCGTTYCIAGYVASQDPQSTVVAEKCNCDADCEETALILSVDGEPVRWSDRAQELLGLTCDERQDLFLDSFTIADVRRVAETIAARAGERL